MPSTWLGFGIVKSLRAMYRKNPKKFAAGAVNEINRLKHMLKWIALVKCPSYHGMGTQRWMASDKHECNRCGGWRWVEEIEETVRENV